MNIRDLKYLVALAEHQHFGKAADACFVSQPALSMQIKKLEDHLGIKLLERTNKSVLLTDHGLVISERAKQILNQVDEIFAIAKVSKDPYAGELKLGIFPTLAPYLLPQIIPTLSKKFPKLSLLLIEEKTATLIEKLKSGKLDAILIALPIIETNFFTVPLFDEEFLLAIPNNHELAKRKTLRQQDLNHKNLLLLDEGHCLREQALTVCQKANASETQDFRATSLETLRHMVSAGVGITLMPKLACTPTDRITYVPFSTPKPMRTIGLVWRNGSAKQILLNEISVQIKQILEKQKNVVLRN